MDMAAPSSSTKTAIGNNNNNICRRYPNGTPLSQIVEDLATPASSALSSITDADDDDDDVRLLSVASYNLLAPVYVRPIDKRTGGVQPFAAFEWVDTDDVLAIAQRGPRLLHAMRQSDADVICIQELQLDRDDRDDEEDKSEQLDDVSDSATDPSPPHRRRALVLQEWFRPILDEYAIRLPPEAELETIAARNRRVLGADAAVTCAVLYRRDRVAEVVVTSNDDGKGDNDVGARSINQKGNKAGDVADTNVCVSVCLKKRRKRRCVGDSDDELVQLPPQSSGEEEDADAEPTVVVTSVHLDAKDEKTRVGQLAKSIKRAARHYAAGGQRMISTIIAGDMNHECSLGSCVAGYLEADGTVSSSSSSPSSTATTPSKDEFEHECGLALRLGQGQQPNPQQIQEWETLYQEVKDTVQDYCISLDRIDTGPTRSAYDHDDDHSNKDDDDDGDDGADGTTTTTTRRRMKQWRLDHIFYTRDTAQPRAQWSTLEADVESCQVGLPNHRVPSDHLPIGAVFQLSTPPVLSEQQRAAVVDRIRALEEKQRQELLETTTSFDTQLSVLEMRLHPTDKPRHADADDSSSNKKKTAKAKGKPPKEIMDLMREKRSQLKRIKAKHKEERATSLDDLLAEDKDDAMLYRFCLQHHVGCTARQWVEHG